MSNKATFPTVAIVELVRPLKLPVKLPNDKVRFFLTGQFLPRIPRDWDQVLTNGFLHCVSGRL